MQERDPLHLCKTVAPRLAALDTGPVELSAASPVATIDHAQHLSHLKAVAVLKMVRQLSSAYSVMRMDRLAELIPFLSFSEVEAVLSDAVKFGYVQLHINHRTSTLHFQGHQLRNDRMAGHLSSIAGRLSAGLQLIKPGEIVAAQDARRCAATLSSCGI